ADVQPDRPPAVGPAAGVRRGDAGVRAAVAAVRGGRGGDGAADGAGAFAAGRVHDGVQRLRAQRARVRVPRPVPAAVHGAGGRVVRGAGGPGVPGGGDAVSECVVKGYAVVIEQAETNLAAHVPELPGCVATAATHRELRRRIS